MLYTIGAVLIVILSLCGIVFFIKELTLLLSAEDCGEKILLLTDFKDKPKQAEWMLRSAVAGVEWCGKKRPQKIICVDNGLSEETRRICRLFCRDHPFVLLKTPQEISDMLLD